MTAALVLAAGIIENDSNFDPGSVLNGMTPVRRIIDTYKDAGVDKIIFITGYNAENIELNNSKHNVLFLRNKKYASSDMLSSIKIGLRYLTEKYDRVFISPVYTPFYSVETVITLMTSEAPEIEVITPICHGKTGHPLLVKASVFDEIKNYKGCDGLEFLLSAPKIKKLYIDVPDKGVLFSLKDDYTSYEYNDIISNLPPKKLRPQVRVRLCFTEPFFGEGVFDVLRAVQEFGNLAKASRQIGISYAKAWKIIKTAEETLGFPLTESHSGRNDSKRTILTARCVEFIQRYETHQREVLEFAEHSFEESFGDIKSIW